MPGTAPAGYLAGTFDLLHVGHLHAVSRARQTVDHLTVGVLTDARAEAMSGRSPYVSGDERLEIVAHVSGVDEAFLVGDFDAPPSHRRFDTVFAADRRQGFVTPEIPGLPSQQLVGTRETSSTALRAAFDHDSAQPSPRDGVAPGRVPPAMVTRDGRRVGYVPGAFDTFHVGHLNILKRAREHCDVLIAGVVEDEVIVRVKGHAPVVPLAERMEVVAALHLVDFTVPDWTTDKFAMWEHLRFDVLFKGDDWKGTARGDALQRDLAAVGAEVVYFPYTRGTSSTFIRELLSLDSLTQRSPRPHCDARNSVPLHGHGSTRLSEAAEPDGLRSGGGHVRFVSSK